MRLNNEQAKLILTEDAYKTYIETDYEIYLEDANSESPEDTYTVTDATGMVILTCEGIGKVNYLFENWGECL